MNSLPNILRLSNCFVIFETETNDLRIQSLTQNIRLSGTGNAGWLRNILNQLDGTVETSALLSQLNDEQKKEAEKIFISLLQSGVLENAERKTYDTGKISKRYNQQLLLFSHFETPDSNIAMNTLRDEEKRRSIDFHLKLRSSKVTVLGIGQTGSMLIRALTLFGVGLLKVADCENVTPEDVWYGAWYDSEEIGTKRTDVIIGKVKKLNADINVTKISWPENSLSALSDRVFADTDLIVVCLDNFVPNIYESVNKLCIEKNIPWISYQQMGFEVTIGPFVIPGQSPCYKCADLRLLSNLSDPLERIHLNNFLNYDTLKSGKICLTFGIDFLAMEIIKFLTGISSPSTLGNILIIGTMNGQTRLRPLLKVPRCPHCGKSKAERPAIDSWLYANDS